jgi:hypothetical protein
MDLSDPQLELQVADRFSFRVFLGTTEVIPDYSTGTCLAPYQSFLNLQQNVFRPEKLNNAMLILIR